MKCVLSGALLAAVVASQFDMSSEPVMAYVDEIRCETATTHECRGRCVASNACQTARFNDAVWSFCRRDMGAKCLWYPFVYFTTAVRDTSRSCANNHDKSIMLTRSTKSFPSPFTKSTPTGIRWSLNPKDLEACRRVTFTVEISPGPQNIHDCLMHAATKLSEYEKHENVSLTVIDERTAYVAAIVKNESSEVIKTEGLTVKVTINDKHMAQQCLLLNKHLPENPALIQGRAPSTIGQ